MKLGLTDQPTNQPTDQPTYGRTQGMLHFQLSSICLKAEATKLNEAGVKILIALGHSGYDIEQVVEQPNKGSDRSTEVQFSRLFRKLWQTDQPTDQWSTDQLTSQRTNMGLIWNLHFQKSYKKYFINVVIEYFNLSNMFDIYRCDLNTIFYYF